MQKKWIVIFLSLISAGALGSKLFLIDFNLFPPEDTIGHIGTAISITNGDFTPYEGKTLGWSAFLSIFYNFFESESFLEYAAFARIVSLGLSTGSIFGMYLLGRKFFPEKYSITVAALFAFEPHLNYNSGLGLTEPLFIFLMIFSFYFILNKNTSFAYLAFLIGGLVWLARFSGLVILVVLSIVYFINFRKNSFYYLKYIGCIVIFFLIVSPMMINRAEYFGDPFYTNFQQKIFSGNFSSLQSENTQNLNYSASDYINDKGFSDFFNRFILTGIFNLAQQIVLVSFPYMIILLPFGILFSFRAFDQKSEYIKANWIMILVALGFSVITFSVIPERRFLFYLFPFLIIFATIPIQRLVEYGLSTFSFSKKQKNLVLVIIVLIIILISSIFTLRYEPSSIEQEEKIKLGKYLIENFDGRIVDAGNILDGLYMIKLLSLNDVSKITDGIDISYIENEEKNTSIDLISISGNTLNDFIMISDDYNVKYICISDQNITIWYPYLDDIYNNEEKYPFLKKVFDSDDIGLKTIKGKIFEINYNRFYQNAP